MNMVNCQLSGRNQRPKWLNVKQVLQYALLLAICIWLLYQIQRSPNERKNSGGSTARKFGEEQDAVSLGRKGHGGLHKGDSDSDSDLYSINNLVKENEKKEDHKRGYELDSNSKEKAKANYYDEEEINKERISEKTKEKEQDKGEAHKEIDEDQDTIKMKSSGGNGGMGNEVSFHDENGIPQDVKDESIWTESSDDRKSSL